MKIVFKLLGFELQLDIKRYNKQTFKKVLKVVNDAKLNFGPGPNWKKPNDDWLSIDIDPNLGDVVVDFQNFKELPFKENSIECVYGSHVFEHMSIFKTPIIFSEIFRVLKTGGVLRIILPDVEKSIHEYINGNEDFLLFKRRKDRAKVNYNRDYTLFECLKEDFLSPNGQVNLLGINTLAHQNAWDFDAIKADLVNAGFDNEKIIKMSFQKSNTSHFQFEGTYSSEANEYYRSLYVEAIK